MIEELFIFREQNQIAAIMSNTNDIHCLVLNKTSNIYGSFHTNLKPTLQEDVCYKPISKLIKLQHNHDLCAE